MSFTVLIVDDSAMMRRLIRSSIEQHLGWRDCIEAENGHLAVEQSKRITPNAVILDWQMPVMNGIDAAREISRISPKSAIALFTLHDQELPSEDLRAAGIQQIFSTTQNLTHLLEWLRKIGKEHAVVGT